jgi:hypothetical protein
MRNETPIVEIFFGVPPRDKTKEMSKAKDAAIAAAVFSALAFAFVIIFGVTFGCNHKKWISPCVVVNDPHFPIEDVRFSRPPAPRGGLVVEEIGETNEDGSLQ